MDTGRGLKKRGTYASEASWPQKLEKLPLGGNSKFFGYGAVLADKGDLFTKVQDNSCLIKLQD